MRITFVKRKDEEGEYQKTSTEREGSSKDHVVLHLLVWACSEGRHSKQRYLYWTMLVACGTRVACPLPRCVVTNGERVCREVFRGPVGTAAGGSDAACVRLILAEGGRLNYCQISMILWAIPE